ncbi:alpha-L-fucosidase [Candidatus Sumerlaeota bacterium]|nr:alpha-L-fucosidase [Candidatus Sumerlaeota bacterium]
MPPQFDQLRASGSGVARALPDPIEIAPGPFRPTWESFKRYRCPDWFRDAKFGVWSHWSPQSLSGAGDWCARHMYVESERQARFHRERYGHPSEFGYKDICNLWKAERFDPERLMDLFRRAGARYFVALANHHDNFDNWDSKYQPWNSVSVGPRKDIVGLWRRAAVERGLKFGVSVHNVNSWGWFDPARDSDKEGPKAGVPYDALLTRADGKGKWWEGFDPADLYAPPHRPGPEGDPPPPEFMARWFWRTRDLIDAHRPDLIYFDTYAPRNAWRQFPWFEDYEAAELVACHQVGMMIGAHYYNANRAWNGGALDGVLNLKGVPEEWRSRCVLDIERGGAEGILPDPWQTDTSLGDWHYRENDTYKDARTVIHTLIDTVSKNGTLLVNVVQKGDGTLAGNQEETLEEIGRWLDVNGEAIYGTRPWKIWGEGPTQVEAGYFKETATPYTAEDIRFTTKGDTLYAIALGWPGSGMLRIQSLGKSGENPLSINQVTLLGHAADIEWTRDDVGLSVRLPEERPTPQALALRIR